jgi:hypothetical protein
LGLVVDGRPTLGYSSLEHFLGDLEALGVAQPLGDGLAQRYLALWPPASQGSFFYLDNRRKVRYSSYQTAAGKISASDRILGGTTQLFVHDAAGHCLHMHSGPADDHLTRTLGPFLHHFAAQVGRQHIRGIVADQEMRSVRLLLTLQAADFGFVTLGRTPTVHPEAAFEIEGLFVPYLGDPQTGQTTHWVAQAQTLLQDRVNGLSLVAQVTLLADCRAGMPGRLIPVLHNLTQADVGLAFPHRLYVGRWQGQERRFRDMRPCQNLDAHYGQKKMAVPNRHQARAQDKLGQQLQTQAKRVTTAQQKIQTYTQQLQTLEQQFQYKQAENQAQVARLRHEGQQALTRRTRESRIRQVEKLAAQLPLLQLRCQQKRRHLLAQQTHWQNQLAEAQQHQQQLSQALQQLHQPFFYDFDLEKDNLMTYLRMAGENAHRFVQEKYFTGTLFEKVDEVTMVRLIYNQPGYVQQRGSSVYVCLQGYRAPAVQAAVVQACQRVNQAQIELLSGHLLHMEVSSEILDW